MGTKKLDSLIKAKGWRKGQSVKLGYHDIEAYANQRVVEELEAIEAKFPYNCAIEDYGWIWVDLKNRIEELKQD